MRPNLGLIGVPGKPELAAGPPPARLRTAQRSSKAELKLRARNFPSSRHTSPVGFDRTHDNRTLHGVEMSSGGRSSTINRRMSAKSFLGIATSAIWNATCSSTSCAGS